MEGSLCYNPATDCDKTGLELPIWNYTHDVGNAIIGGYVYHGSTLPALTGELMFMEIMVRVESGSLDTTAQLQ